MKLREDSDEHSFFVGAEREIAALVHQMHLTVLRLNELTNGEVDSVVSPAGETFLLQEAQAQLRQSNVRHRESAAIQSSIMDALPARIALLDHQGIILSVNEGWRQFSIQEAPESGLFGVGQNYLEACERAPQAFDEGSVEAAAGIRSVLDQIVPEFTFEYACHTPSERRWFRLMVRPMEKDGLCGAVVMHVDITARKLAQEEALSRENQLQTLFDLMPAMLCFKDTKNNFLRVNKRLAEASAKTVAEMEGKSAFVIYPLEADKYYADDLEVIQSKQPKLGIFERMRDWFGRERQLRTDKVPVQDHNGMVIGLVVLSQDVTENQKLEQRLQESEALLRTAGRAARLGGWSCDVPAGRLVWSTEVCAIHEVPAGTSPALDEALQFYSLAHREEIRRRFEICARDGSPFDLEAELITATGRAVWVRAIGEAVRGVKGDITRVQGAFQDISARRHDEQALRESEERFRQITDNISEIFWMTNPTRSQILYVSPAFERIWAQSPEDLYRDPEGWMRAIHPDDRERVAAAIRDRLKLGAFEEVYRILRHDETTRWIRDRAFPVRDEKGNIHRVVGVAEDITEIRKLEARFLRSQRMECIGTLAGGIAHDLNNILTPVLISTTMMRNASSLKDLEPIIPLIEASARRGAEVVRQLLIFGRGAETQRVWIQVGHLLKEMVDIIRETFPKNIKLAFKLPNELWPVRGDATQLHQVLLNLCVNARDAMPDGGELTLKALNIHLDDEAASRILEAKAGSYLQLALADTGTGIPPEIIAKIFEPFYTTKPTGQGTGLGLSTVLGIVQNHGGFINVFSEVSRGTKFDIYLPAMPEAFDLDAPPVKTPPAPKGQGEWVLLVDDEPEILALTGAILDSQGYIVLTAKDGMDALDKFAWNSKNIRVVVTDLMMPRLDGVGLVKGLREMEPNIKVIVTSGSINDARAEVKIAALNEMGINQMLAKPYSAEALLKLLHEMLQKES